VVIVVVATLAAEVVVTLVVVVVTLVVVTLVVVIVVAVVVLEAGGGWMGGGRWPVVVVVAPRPQDRPSPAHLLHQKRVPARLFESQSNRKRIAKHLSILGQTGCMGNPLFLSGIARV